MGLLFDILCALGESEEDKKKKELEKKMSDAGLEDWQKELVRKGEYEPHNFEEEDLEEDDYYFEDED